MYINVLYTLIAATLAAIGLVRDSPSVVVTSVLISPATLGMFTTLVGWRTRDKEAILRGLASTLLCAMLCVSVGLSGGVVMALLGHPPSPLMLSKTYLEDLPWSALVSFLCGLAAGISIAEGSTSVLSAVAVNCSVVPSLVDFGMLFAYIETVNDDAADAECIARARVTLFLALANVASSAVGTLIPLFFCFSVQRVLLIIGEGFHRGGDVLEGVV